MSLKKKHDNEVDLIDLFVILWNGKSKIISITILIAIAMYMYLSSKQTDKIIYSIKTEIQPISIYEELKYGMYNALVRKYNSSDIYFINQNKLPALIKENNYDTINKDYLLDLYIGKLHEKSILMRAIEKFGFKNKNDYQNIENYKKDVKKLADTIKLSKSPNDGLQNLNWNIEFKTSDKENWEKFLLFIDNNANKEIKDYLRKKFDQQILQEIKIIEYQIEDIDTLISNSTDKIENIELLNKNKERLTLNFIKFTRIKNAFYNSPIVKSDNGVFNAAKFDVYSTKYSKEGIRSNSPSTLFFISVVIGLIFGILITLIENSVRKRFAKKI